MNTKTIWVCGFAVTIFLFCTEAVAQNQPPTVGTKMDDGRIFLLQESIEAYWNDWSGISLSNASSGQADIHIKGEGKTVDFDVILSINCESGSGYYWKTADNFGKSLSLSKINEGVPLMVVANAKLVFCKG